MKTILIIEDDFATGYMLECVLAQREYTVMIANTLRDAYQKLHSCKVDLVVLDRYLPDGLGDEFLRKIRQQMHADIPVLVFSGSTQGHIIKQLMDAGATDYILKPTAISDFTHIVERWI